MWLSRKKTWSDSREMPDFELQAYGVLASISVMTDQVTAALCEEIDEIKNCPVEIQQQVMNFVCQASLFYAIEYCQQQMHDDVEASSTLSSELLKSFHYVTGIDPTIAVKEFRLNAQEKGEWTKIENVGRKVCDILKLQSAVISAKIATCFAVHVSPAYHESLDMALSLSDQQLHEIRSSILRSKGLMG